MTLDENSLVKKINFKVILRLDFVDIFMALL